MGYKDDLMSAADWLSANQRPDYGWGLTRGHASSLVNTAEALFVLRRADKRVEYEKGIHFLKENVSKHIEFRGAKTRYVAYTLYALAEQGSSDNSAVINECVLRLEAGRNDEGVWGDELGRTESSLIATCQTIWALQKVGIPESENDRIYKWLIAEAKPGGWGLRRNSDISPVATGQACLCLGQTGYRDHPIVQDGKGYLLGTKEWGYVEEEYSGTIWKHSTFAWVIPALVSLGVEPCSEVIIEGVSYIKALRSQEGGWNERLNTRTRTVRAQFWAVIAYEYIKECFDPQEDIVKIRDVKEMGGKASPRQIPFKFGSALFLSVHKRLYVWVAYSLVIVALFILLGFHRFILAIPGRYDAGFAILILVFSWFMIKKKQGVFATLARITDILLAVVAGTSLLFGISLYSFLLKFKKLFSIIIEYCGSWF